MIVYIFNATFLFKNCNNVWVLDKTTMRRNQNQNIIVIVPNSVWRPINKGTRMFSKDKTIYNLFTHITHSNAASSTLKYYKYSSTQHCYT